MFDHRSAIMVVVILLGLAVLAHTVSAQFAGDLFFQEPSIAVAQNHTGRLTLQAFAGSDPLGAVHVELTYDSHALDIVDVIPGADFQAAGSTVSKVAPGQVVVVLANMVALDRPIGTIDLITIEARAMAPPGTIIPIEVARRGYLHTDGSANTTGQPFGAEIVVGTPTPHGSRARLRASEIDTQEGTAPAPVGDVYDRAARLRPPGATVTLYTFDRGQIRAQQVQTAPRTDVITD
jgi:hypothetical protein